jgi:hypothetical protein
VIPPDAGDRDLVCEVFARTRTPARPDLASRVRERLAEERRRRRADGTWQLTLAGGVLVGAMVAGLLVDEGVLQWPMQSAPAPAAVTTLSSGGTAGPAFALPPADGSPGAPRRVDWEGRTVGSFPAAAGVPGAGVSPDGALVAVPGPSGADVLSAGGRRLASVDAFGAWSGDGAHVTCALVSDGASVSIVLLDLRDAARPRQTVRRVTGLDRPGPGWSLAGCAFRSNRLVAMSGDETAIVTLDTGRVASRVASGDESPVLSADARHLAANDPEHRSAAIWDLDSGQVTGHVTGLVAAFSGDGDLVLTDSELGAPSPGSRAALVDWRWNRPVWSAPGHATALAVEPGGQTLALALAADPAAPARRLLVDPGGRPLDLDPQPASATHSA